MADKVELVNDQKIFTTQEGESILAAALRQGIVIPHNCRNGFCGSCMGKLHSGKVEYAGDRPRGLSEMQEKEGYVLCCSAMTSGDVKLDVETIDAVADIEIKTLPCRVSRLEKLADDVMLLEIKLPPHERFEFRAGQYIDFLLRDNRRRSFSMANSPSIDDRIELHIREVADGQFTGQVFHEMKEKDMLRIQGPFGTFILRDTPGRPSVLVAGGTGIAPIKSMLEKIRESGCDRDLHLYWGVRTRNDLYIDSTLRQYAEEIDCLSYTPVLSGPGIDADWSGATGWVHEAVMSDFSDLSGMDVYASGPPQLIDAIKLSYPGIGLEPGHFYFDSFEYASDGP